MSQGQGQRGSAVNSLYGKYLKKLYTKMSHQMAYANSADADQTAPGMLKLPDYTLTVEPLLAVYIVYILDQLSSVPQLLHSSVLPGSVTDRFHRLVYFSDPSFPSASSLHASGQP